METNNVELAEIILVGMKSAKDNITLSTYLTGLFETFYYFRDINFIYYSSLYCTLCTGKKLY